MSRQRFALRRAADAQGTPPAKWMLGPYPFCFAHESGFAAVPRVAILEAQGWQRVGAVPGLSGFYVMKRDSIGVGD